MVRATRSRKPHPKYSSEQYELSSSPKKSPVKKISTKTEAAAPGGLRSGLRKGNLNSGLRTLTGTRTVVLRDRTNLHEEALKVDVLIKQGPGPGVASKLTKPRKVTRAGGSKTLGGKDQKEIEKTSSVEGTRKKRKLENDAEEMALEDLKTRKKTRPDAEKMAEPTKRVTRAVEKSVAASKSGKIEPEIMKKPTAGRKKVSKDEKDENPEVSDEPEPSPGITRSSSTRNSGQPAAKTTRKIVKSTENDEKSVKPKMTRKTTRQVVAARESSPDSGLGTREVAEIEENPQSELKTAISKEPEKRASRRESRTKIDKVSAKNAIGEKKFFKTKPAERKMEKCSPMKKTVTAKRRNVGTARLSVSFRSRQATLQESFAKQIARKVLRPRKSQRNYCEETMVEKRSGPKTGNDEPKKSGPVYKSIKPEDDSSNDKNAVYDFKFDSNDSREKLQPKKRKRILRKKIVTKKATKTTSEKAETKKIDKVERVSIESEKQAESHAPEMDNFPEEINDLPVENEKIVEQAKKVEKMAEIASPAKPRVVESVQLKGNDCLTLTTTPVLAKSSETKTRNHLRPPKQFRTMLSHALLNKSISPITKAIENFDPGSPWRPPVFQDFSRVKNIVQSTPQVRNFTAKLQSVPEKTVPAESKKMQVLEKKNEPKMTKMPNEASAKSPRKFGTEISPSNNDQIVVSRLPDSEKENSTEIEKKSRKIEPPAIQDRESTAVESRLSFPSSNNFGGDTINLSPGDKENSLPVGPGSIRSPLKPLNRAPFGNLDNSPLKNLNRSPLKSLQNSPSKNLQKSPLKNLQNVPSENLQNSPLKNLQKSPLKNLQNSPLKNLQNSPLKSLENLQKSPLKKLQNSPLKSLENLQKSPLKKLQKSPLKDPKKILEMLRAKKQQNPVVENDSRILRQSNLDNFLNLDEMPKSTRINTLHGIFDDAHSTPISGKPAKKTSKESNVENAFGFDVSDEDSEAEISPIKKSMAEVPAEKKVLTKIEEKSKIAVPARLSIGDIKKHLLPMRKKAVVEEKAAAIERIEEEDEAKEKSPEKAKKPKITRVEKVPDPVDFSDTFDVHEKSENIEDNTTMKFELFADIEPQHFKQAPRYSYKRKRAVGFHFSDGEDENNENVVEQTESVAPKRRKINKAEQERNKKLENWAKDLNQTFEEIEHFDLVVE